MESRYKKKFGQKDIKNMNEVIAFLNRKAKISEKNMDSTAKRAYESEMFKLIDVLYK